MALLTVNERKAIFKQLGFGEYNEKSIKAFQKKYMLRKSDCDGVYGPNTDNTLRTVFYTLKYTKNFKPEEAFVVCEKAIGDVIKTDNGYVLLALLIRMQVFHARKLLQRRPA